jgi:hypothetical protein
VQARIAATRLNPQLDSALNLEVPHHVTEQQAKDRLHDFVEISLMMFRYLSRSFVTPRGRAC